ncbi:MAG: hypothetical protein BWX85_00083 [Chloroflexi bacterium ADurb.Bin120]|jgi:hypothetical protein|uniref:Uncharacterized protein n=2 Tax=Candidatus Brevifilum fermentans TaxID=1986204 RepID=A0A1Y6K075_9CHLR|nr:hypothetical protein [Chloroflexota bacterium]OQB88043.1 MAG: hypothetical protein BWX85_00083 [Chloroflexi bacterium ADurb.Bin120]SMX53105.1 conserved protein of unknown function [Brevefilum fermentans]HOM67432.1 hypothetical protein [Brevefilum fermentans]
MMIKWQPWKIILLGGSMMLISVILPLLMVLQILQSSFFLNFLTYGLSVAGLLIGFIGMVTMVRVERAKQKFKDQFK